MEPADKASIQEPLDRLKKAIEANNTEDMKTETDNVTNAFSKVAEKIYAQVQPEGAQGQPNPQDFTGFNPGAGAAPDAGAEGSDGFKSAGGDF
jgi:molecular chaperone DnaK